MFRKLVAKSAAKWLGSPRGKKRSPWRHRLPLSLEMLESRILLSADNWIGGSGNWDAGANWSLGAAPGTGDTAIINTSSAATITIKSGDAISVQSVTTGSNDTLSITGGSLTVTSGTSTLSGALSMSGGTVTATGTGVSLTADGSATASNASLFANGGATLSLPNLTSYANTVFNDATTFEASGAGSKLTLGALAAIDGFSNGSPLYINAAQGGAVSLTALTTIDPASSGDGSAKVNVSVDGAGSTLDVSALTSYNGGRGGDLSVTNGGTVLDGKLTSLSGVNVTLDGTGTMATNQWTTLTYGSITVNAGSYIFSGLTDITESSLSALSGASLALPAVASYADTVFNDDTTFEASGAGSKLTLGALAAIDAFSQGNQLYISAVQGGVVSLAALTTIDPASSGDDFANVNVSVDGGGSTIDVSALTSYNGGRGGDLSVTNGGTVLDGKLTSLSSVNVTLDGTDPQVGDSWTSIIGGNLTISGGAVTLSNLTNLSPSSFQLTGGATLSLPVLMQGTLTLSSGQSVTIRGTLVSIPATGTSGASINVPQSPGMLLTLQTTGTLTDTTFNVGAGTMLALNGGTYLGTTTFNVAQGASVDLTGGGTTNYGGTLTGAGSGNVVFSGGLLKLTTGGLTLNFPGSMFQWTGGGFNTALGNVTNLGTIALAGSSDKVVYNDGTLDNKGTIIQTGSGNLGLHSDNVSPTTLINDTGGYYLIESDSGIDNLAGGQVAVQNAGTLKKTAGTGTSQLYINGPLSNTGTIEADSGTLFLDANSITQVANNTLSAGTWNALNGATLKFPSGTSITTNQANVSLTGSGASISGLAGLATNSGTLTVGSGAVLNLSGNFTQTAAGTLSDQIDSTLGGGQLAVSGTATLGGNFKVSLPSGFNPPRNTVYPVMTYTSASGSFAQVSGLGSSLTEQISATSIDLTNGTGTPVALQLSQVTAPTTATTGQQITVNWTVKNAGSTAASGSWQDSVYLSTTPAITGSSVLLGSVPHSGGLAANGSYNASLNAVVAALPPGNYYVLVQADSLDQVLVANRASDIMAASTGQLAVSVPGVTLGTPSNGTFTAADQDQYYQVTVPAGGSLQVSLTSAASSGALALYVSQGAQPTAYNYQESANLAGQPNQSLNVPVTGAGTYYILVHSISGAAATAGYTLSVTQTNALTVSAPSRAYTGGNGGNLTLDIKGTNFTNNTTASLTLGNNTINASSIYLQSATEIYATFNLKGAATGNYTLAVQDGSQQATAPATVAVVPASTGNPLQFALALPSMVSAGRDGIVNVAVKNVSNNDVLAPLLFLTADGATMKLPSQSGFQGAMLNFLATSPTGPAGILLPGQSMQVAIQFRSTTTNPTIEFQLYQAEDSQPMDWAAAKSSLQGNTPTAAWNVIWSNFLANVGNTVGSYHTVLANDATYLGQLGEYGNDVNTLLDFELDKAADDFITPTLTTVTDVNFPAPGLPLTFVRTFQQPIDRRSTPGPLGLGWTDNWQLSLSTDAQGNVTINDNGQGRYFALQSDGSYQPGPGDFATLTLAKGIYQLKETDGSLLVFNSDGTLNYQQDTNGNRITCGYSNGQLTSLTSSDGQKITIAYNTQGLISQVTAPDGQTTTYTYDSAQHLVSYTDQYGTTNYTYLSGQSNPAAINALSEIAYADNTHLYFGYDSQGRLIDQHRDNGQEDISYNYLPVNGYTATDGDGNKTTYLIDNAGNVCEVISPLGNLTRYTYDDNGNVAQATAPLGVTYSYSYDAKGNLISETDALGHTTTFAYDANNKLTSYTDAKGDTTAYGYDSNNNLLSITYANGTKQQYSYNPLGEATQFLNARGDAIGYTYNTQGQILTESFANGTSFTYTYDSHGNLTSAKDAQGNVTTFVYGTTNNPNLLTEVEYPDGTFLKFTYNIAGQRTQSVDQTGFTVNYTYDALGRLSKLTDGSNNLIVQYTYDAAGNLIQKDMGNGTRTVYTYDAADEVLSITNYAPDHTTVNSFDKYTYDALGNVLTDTNQDGQWVYTYDADSQLIQAVFTPNSSDPDGLAAQNLQYVYDVAGNRISETINGVSTTYAVNNVNEYTSATTNGVTTTYQYDLDGNLIAQLTGSNTTDYTFNDLNQLTAVNGPSLSASYSYDALGNRVSQTIDGVTTKFQIDPAGLGNMAAEYDGSGNLITHYNYGLGLVSQVTAGGSTGYYDFGLTGNTVGITDSGGAYVNRYAYLPFGQTMTIAAAHSNPFTFVGQFGVTTDGTGLSNMRARNYTSATGQFVSNDPLGIVAGDPNIRRYARNTPTYAVDPGGLCFLPHPPPVLNSPFPEGDPHDPFAHGSIGPDYEPPIYHPQPLGPEPENNPYPFEWDNYGPGATPADWLMNHFDLYMPAQGDPPNTGGPAGPPGCQHNSPPPSPPPPPGDPGPPGGCPNHTPHDPNALIGPAGYGTQGFIQPNGAWSYTVDFENDGTAAALDVTVTEQLDPHLDWSTFQLGSFGFGAVNIAVPAGLTQYQTTVAYQNADGTALNVKVSLNFNVQTGLLTVTFASIDPATGQSPTGALDGFLPPDDSTHVGEGFVQYTVQPKSNLAGGTAINGQASVVFDTNAAIQTQTVVNTIDAAPPSSSVHPLPASTTLPNFTVSWSGSDANGPGIASYNVYVSDNGGAFKLWQANTTQTSATYNGQINHRYSFYSVASDALGLTQPTPSGAQATTFVYVPSPPPPPPYQPPQLQVPPLLALFDSFLGGVETYLPYVSETITDSFFGIPFLVSTFDPNGNLESVDLFGFLDITFLFG